MSNEDFSMGINIHTHTINGVGCWNGSKHGNGRNDAQTTFTLTDLLRAFVNYAFLPGAGPARGCRHHLAMICWR